jgi:hypothetical protein
LAAIRHGIPGVDRQVQNNLLNHARITFDGGQVGGILRN